MGYIEGNSFISMERYRDNIGDRLTPAEFEVDSICFAMFALKANRLGHQAAQFPAKIKSRPEHDSGVYVVKFCFLGTDLEEAPTFNAGFEESGFFINPEGYVANEIPSYQGYLRTYDDGYDDFLRQCSTGLTIGASA